METSICHVRMIFVSQMLSHPYILAAVTFLGAFAKELLQRIHLTTRVNNLKRLETNQGSVDGKAPDGLGHFGTGKWHSKSTMGDSHPDRLPDSSNQRC